MSKSVDVCIVGSGAGGAPIAYELAKAGFSVVVLEKGPHYSEADFNKDEIDVSRRDKFTPNLKDEQHVIETYDDEGEIERYMGSESNWSFWNGSMVGGSSNLMSGYFHRMKEDDFKLLSKYGKIEGANVVDWPISYDDLEPYYDKVEKVVGVSGTIVPHKFLERRSSKNFPYEATWVQPISHWFDKACVDLGYVSLPTPRAVLPYDALGRTGCSYSNLCGSFGCSTGAKGNARAALLVKALRYDNCTLFSESYVTHIDSNDKRATKVHYIDAENNKHFIEAKIIVVAAQAIESSRLLLNSKNKFFPHGLANNSGNVGKNLIFSAGGSGEGRIEMKNLSKEQADVFHTRGAFVNRSLQDWYDYEDSGALHKGGTIDFLYEHANAVPRALGQVYDDEGNLLWGSALEERLKYAFEESRVFTFEVFNDWLPTDKCFVSTDEDVQDKWGMNVGRIRLYSHPKDVQVGEHLAQRAEKVLEQLGAVDISSNISTSPPPNLVAGGCRFGNDPKTSVLDVNCKAHELENLYVSDASFMPTGGSVPYTWTIYANSFRIADKIIEQLRS